MPTFFQSSLSVLAVWLINYRRSSFLPMALDDLVLLPDASSLECSSHEHRSFLFARDSRFNRRLSPSHLLLPSVAIPSVVTVPPSLS